MDCEYPEGDRTHKIKQTMDDPAGVKDQEDSLYGMTDLEIQDLAVGVDKMLSFERNLDNTNNGLSILAEEDATESKSNVV